MSLLKIRLMGLLIAAAFIVSLIPAGASDIAADEPSSWAAQQITILETLNLGDKQIYSNFRQDITREEFSMLVSSLYEYITGKTIEVGQNSPFNDIIDSRYKTEILKANSIKVISGLGNGKFSPKGKVTRQQVAVMIYNTIKACHPGVGLVSDTSIIFKDNSKIASWAKPAITFLYNNYIMGGVADLTAGPLGYTTREQALLFVFKAGMLTGMLNETSMLKLKDKNIDRKDSGKIEDLKSRKPDDYYELARKYVFEEGKLDSGIAAYNKAIELKPDYAPAYGGRAEVYFFKGMYDESMESVTKAMELDPNDGWNYVHRGKIYSLGKENDKAIADFTKAIELLTDEDPNNPDIAGLYNHRAWAYFQKVMIKEGIADIKTASKYEPAAGDVLLLLGIKE